jgi:hypothetical protein
LFSVRTHGHVALVLMVGGEHSTESESMRFRSSSGLLNFASERCFRQRSVHFCH